MDMDNRLFEQAARGDFTIFEGLGEDQLKQLVTPFYKDTILHIHITARSKDSEKFKKKPLIFLGKLIYLIFPMASTKERLKLIGKLGDGIISLKLIGKSRVLSEPAYYYCDCGFVRKVLERCNAMLSMTNANNETLLHLAARYRHEDMVQVLIETQKAKAMYEDMVQVLIHETQKANGDEEVAKPPDSSEIQQAATRRLLGIKNKAGNTALHEAVRYDHLQVVMTLIDADPNHSYGTNNDGKTPLYLAAEMSDCEVVQRILDHCTSPAYQGPDGKTALHAAVLRNDEEISWLVAMKLASLTKEADVSGLIPLHYAAREGFLGVVKILMGEDKLAATIGDKRNMTALHIAAKYRRVDVMSEILSLCPLCYELVDIDGQNLLHIAVESNSKKTLAAALRNPFVRLNLVDRENKEGKRPLDQLPSTFDFYRFVKDLKQNPFLFLREEDEVDDIDGSYATKKLLQLFLREEDEVDDIDEGIGGAGTEMSNKDSSGEDESKKKGTRKERVREDLRVYKENIQIYLLVATLVATVTFAAAFTMPGGYVSDKGPDQGSPVLIKLTSFRVFIIADIISLALSISAVIIPIYMRRNTRSSLRAALRVAIEATSLALFAMLVAFSAGTYAVLSLNNSRWLATCSWVLPLVLVGCSVNVDRILEYFM